MPEQTLQASSIAAAVTEILTKHGYQRVVQRPEEWSTESTRLFEDDYGVVGLVIFSTVSDLLQGWADRQGALVNVMSEQIGLEESKAWDGYLLLLTPNLSPSEESQLEEIRYNTVRLRKIVATGADLKSRADIERVVSGLLPVVQPGVSTQWEGSALDLLPSILERRDISPAVTETLIDAFREQAAMLSRLSEMRHENH